ncbi:hypothetical protein Tcan_14585, partial [Toxocara canis]
GSVKCFCDKRNCEDSLICTGERCLIGFRSDGEQARLDQLCAMREMNSLEKCEQNWNGWQEVCACDDDFCNTFAFLRGSIEQQNTVSDDTRVPILHELQPSTALIAAAWNVLSDDFSISIDLDRLQDDLI